jgi:two-component system, chemotaxis family, sensor kinase CheA
MILARWSFHHSRLLPNLSPQFVDLHAELSQDGGCMSFSEQEIGEFMTEAQELLDVAEKSLLALSAGEDFKTVFDAVFRSFHNVKGASGMMEMTVLQAHTHELETILMGFKEETAMPKPYVDYFLKGIDGARQILDGQTIDFNYRGFETSSSGNSAAPAAPAPAAPVVTSAEASGVAPAPQAVVLQPSAAVAPAPSVAPVKAAPKIALPAAAVAEFVSESEELVLRISRNLRSLEAGAASRTVIDELYRDIHSLKGTSYLFGFELMGQIAHAMESSLEPVREGTHTPSRTLIEALFHASEALELDLECTKIRLPNNQLSELTPTLVKSLVAASGELSTLSAVVSPQDSVIAAGDLAPSSEKPEQRLAKEKEVEALASIRVPVSLLDKLMTLMGEMVLVRNQVLQYSNNLESLDFQTLSQRLNVVTSEIQGEMMKTRMQPIGNITSKFHRVVRDLGQELSKSITFIMEGGETELDKSLLEAIKDPLTHIVRNSCDHGVETPEVRRKAGKPEGGTIVIRSFHEGGQVVIEIVDDGKGLNRDALVAKAIEKGLLTDTQAKNISEKDAFNLIFAPGFSTAAKVTNVSGRGVGMDVVRTNIEKIGGSVALSSRLGKGTTIRLKIPLTLAIVPALIVNSAGNRFAIPQVKLVELLRVEGSSGSHQIETMQGVQVFRLRGEILPLLDLNRVLDENYPRPVEGQVVNIAVLNADNFSFGLILDEILDTADIVVKPLSRALKSLHIYSGATILGDGSVALILDVLGLAKVARITEETHAANSSGRSKEIQLVHSESQDFLVFRIGSGPKHAMPLGFVHRLEEFKASQIDQTGHNRVVRYRDSVLPLVSFDSAGASESRIENRDRPVSIVVVERAGVLYGIEVDEVLDILATTVALDRTLVQDGCIVGNLVMKDELIVVVDPFELIRSVFHADETPLLAKPTSPTIIDPSKHEILLVEDTAFFRRVVKDVLDRAGYRVTLAGDGLEATELLRTTGPRFSLIISDIEMPKMNGFEFATFVRANADHAKTPMLGLSSRFDQKYIQEAKRVGFDLYLEKMRPEVLLQSVAGLIEKRSAA